jgi:hypothetical protein
MGRDDNGALIEGTDADTELPEGMQIIDCVGDWTEAPSGGGWDVCGNGNTKDNTLVRKCGTMKGNGGDWATSASVGLCEWDAMGADYWNKGGYHSGCMDESATYDCSMVSPEKAYHWDGADGPAGYTGFLGWSIVAQDTDCPNDGDTCCALIPTYHPDSQQPGISSWHSNNDGCHDEAHDPLITRSSELWGPVSFSAMTAGGMGTADSPGADDANLNDGFIGVAIRRVSDGAYVASTRAVCPAGSAVGYCSGSWEPISIAATGVAGEQVSVSLPCVKFST